MGARLITSSPLEVALIALLAAFCGLLAVEAQFANSRLDLIRDLQAGRFVTAHEIETSDATATLLARIHVVGYLVIATVFIGWLYRVNKQLEDLGGADLRGAGWSIGGWFVPFLNLWRPLGMVQQAWRANDPRLAREKRDDWRSVPRSRLIVVWWIVFLAAGFIGSAGFSSSGSATTSSSVPLDQLRSSTEIERFGELTLMVAGVLAIMVVIRLTRRHDAWDRTWKQNIADYFESARSSGPEALGTPSELAPLYGESLRLAKRPIQEDPAARAPATPARNTSTVDVALINVILGAMATVLVILVSVLATAAVRR